MKFQFEQINDTASDFWLLKVVITKKPEKGEKGRPEKVLLNSYRGTTKRDCYLRMCESMKRHVDEYAALIEEV